jgi:hypothetical protein
MRRLAPTLLFEGVMGSEAGGMCAGPVSLGVRTELRPSYECSSVNRKEDGYGF